MHATFRLLHPDRGIALAQAWSTRSRQKGELPLSTDLRQEHLYAYALDHLQRAGASSIDAFIFGHRHLPLDVPIDGHNARYINTGDWLTHFSSVVIQDGRAELIRHTPGA